MKSPSVARSAVEIAVSLLVLIGFIVPSIQPFWELQFWGGASLWNLVAGNGAVPYRDEVIPIGASALVRCALLCVLLVAAVKLAFALRNLWGSLVGFRMRSPSVARSVVEIAVSLLVIIGFFVPFIEQPFYEIQVSGGASYWNLVAGNGAVQYRDRAIPIGATAAVRWALLCVLLAAAAKLVFATRNLLRRNRGGLSQRPTTPSG